MKTLFPIQTQARDSLLESLRTYGAALNSSDTGTGKTLVSVEMVRTLPNATLVVCPKIVIPPWLRCFEEQGVPCHGVVNYEKLRAGNTPFGRWRTKTLFEWTLPPETTIVWDEAHRAKGVGTQNSKMLKAAKDAGHRCLILSATVAEDPTELSSIGYALGLHDGKQFATWCQKWGCSLDPWRKLYFPKKNRAKLVELHNQIYPAKGFKISRADMAEFFSQTRIVTEPLDFGDDGAIEKIYEEMEAELAAIDAAASHDKGASALTSRLRARQAVEMLKIPTIAGMVEEAVGEGNSVAVFLNFRASIDALEQRLRMPCGRIEGGQHAAVREETIQQFQANDLHVILCNTSAGGVGVSLHDEIGDRPRLSLLSPTDNAKELHQVLGRIDRAGAKSDTVQRILFASGTIEEEVAKNFRRKLENLSILHGFQKKSVDNTTSAYTETQMPELPDTQPKHAEFGPSSLKHFEICPGYKGREGTNPAAEMGTRIHHALETDDDSGLENDYERLIAERCREARVKILTHHGFVGNQYDVSTYEVHREIRLQIDLGGGLSTFGTSDELCTLGNVGVQIDWKTGRGAIDDAEVNCQAQAYTLGCFQKFPELETIHFYFVIPQRDEISFATYTRADIPRIKLRLATVIRRAQAARECWAKGGSVPVEDLNPQPGTCDYCANSVQCSAIKAKVLTIASRYADDGFPIPAEVHGSANDDPEEIAQMLKVLPIVESWIAGIKAKSRRMVLEEGIEIPGYGVKERAGGKQITNVVAAWDHMKDQMSIEEFLGLMDGMPYGKLGDWVYDRAPNRQKTKAKNALEDALRDASALVDKPTQQFLSAIKN